MLDSFGDSFDKLNEQVEGVFNQTLEEEQKFIHKMGKDF